MRLLKNRQRVLDILLESKKHLTVKQVYEAYQSKFGKACFATIYNSVNYLKEKGKLREIDHVGGNVRYEACDGEHDHLICRICGEIHDIDAEDMSDIKLKHEGFIVERKTTTYHGVCRCCLDSKEEKTSKESVST